LQRNAYDQDVVYVTLESDVSFTGYYLDKQLEEKEFEDTIAYTIFNFLRHKFGLPWHDVICGYGLAISKEDAVYFVTVSRFIVWHGEVRCGFHGKRIYLKEGDNFKEIINEIVAIVTALV